MIPVELVGILPLLGDVSVQGSLNDIDLSTWDVPDGTVRHHFGVAILWLLELVGVEIQQVLEHEPFFCLSFVLLSVD